MIALQRRQNTAKANDETMRRARHCGQTIYTR
jgi:hypothetical protein